MRRMLLIAVAVLGTLVPVFAAAGGQVNGDLERVLVGHTISADARASILRAAQAAEASGIPRADIRTIVQGGLERGMDASVIGRFLSLATDVRLEGSSAGPVLSTIEQGIAKGIAADRILSVAGNVQARLRNALRIVQRARDHGLSEGSAAERMRMQEALAAAFGAGLTEQEANELALLAGENRTGPARFSRAVEASVHLAEAGMPKDLAVRFGRQAIILGYSERRTGTLERAALDMHKEGISWEETFSRVSTDRHRGERGMFTDPGRFPAAGSGGNSGPGTRNPGR